MPHALPTAFEGPGKLLLCRLKRVLGAFWRLLGQAQEKLT